jgi:hypothetical protein
MMGYEDGGSSPQDLTGGIYSKLFELDMHERHITAYRTAEQTAVDYNALDRKNRLGNFGRKMGTNDFRYPFLLCNGFTFSSQAADFLKWTAKGLAYREDRGDYSSAAWTFPTGYVGSTNLIIHNHLTFSIKAVGGAYVELGIKSLSIECDIPLQKEQDSESSLFIMEPVLNGSYGMKLSFVVSRHSADTYLAYRDSHQECIVKAVYASGDYEMGFYFPSLVLPDATVSEDEVSNMPINCKLGYKPASNPFATEFGSLDLIQNGPMAIMCKNTNSVNEMRRE